MKPFVEHIKEVQDVWGHRVPDLALIFLTDRSQRFRKGNDAIWGEGNWEQCAQGCLDGMGYPAFHHIDYHRELFHPDGPFEQAFSAPSETSRPFPKDPVLVIARAAQPGEDFWRCWHVARYWAHDGSIKGVCGAWISFEGQGEFERQDPKDFEPIPRTNDGETCRRKGCVEKFEKLGLYRGAHVV